MAKTPGCPTCREIADNVACADCQHPTDVCRACGKEFEAHVTEMDGDIVIACPIGEED
jgi:hypothetical protein